MDAWVVFHRGVILYVGSDESRVPLHARRISYDGYIFPGLIDTHNHAPWNTIPMWRAGHPFKNRYEWQADPEYLAQCDGVFRKNIRGRLVRDLKLADSNRRDASVADVGLEDLALRYAEVRAVVGGTTLLQSTYLRPEPRLLIRKLDSNYSCDSRIPDIRSIPQEELERFRTGLERRSLRRVFLHLAEGQRSDRERTGAEFPFLESKGLVRPGVVLIHGVGLTREEIQKVARAGMYLVWSPKSNLVLYGETMDVEAALDAGVTIALAPDWTISGSNNVLEEMKVAWQFSQEHLGGRIKPERLFKMVTSDAAKVAGVEGFLGVVAPRYAADLMLAPRRDQDPYSSLLKISAADIHLVFVDGRPVYGDMEEIKKWIRPEAVDPLPLKGSQKGVVTLGDSLQVMGYDLHFPEIEALLEKALPKLAPLEER